MSCPEWGDAHVRSFFVDPANPSPVSKQFRSGGSRFFPIPRKNNERMTQPTTWISIIGVWHLRAAT